MLGVGAGWAGGARKGAMAEVWGSAPGAWGWGRVAAGRRGGGAGQRWRGGGGGGHGWGGGGERRGQWWHHYIAAHIFELIGISPLACLLGFG